MNITKQPKLILIDCDGVLYHPSELNVNTMLLAFNAACDEFNMAGEKLEINANLTSRKPIGGIYNRILSVAAKVDIEPKTFITKIINRIDYSHITPDTDNILELFRKLSKKYRVCICSNNHIQHLNMVLQAKFGITAQQLPFEIFDASFAEQDGRYFTKQSDVFIRKLEKHFGINAADFFWIDDDMGVVNDVAAFGCEAAQITQDYRLIDALNDLLR